MQLSWEGTIPRSVDPWLKQFKIEYPAEHVAVEVHCAPAQLGPVTVSSTGCVGSSVGASVGRVGASVQVTMCSGAGAGVAGAVGGGGGGATFS